MKILFVLLPVLVLVAFLIAHRINKRKEDQPLEFDNLEDVERLSGGIARFTFQDVAYEGTIAEVNYVSLGPGAINVTLLSLRAVSEGPTVPDVPLDFTFSLFLAEIISKPKEISIHHLAPPEGFGPFLSLQVRI